MDFKLLGILVKTSIST